MKVPYKISLLLIFPFFISSCGLFYKDESETDYNLFIIGEKNKQEGEYKEAQKNFKQIIENYPDSNLRAQAILGLADAQFNSGDYLSAEFQYKKFIELYPNHPYIEKGYFYKAKTIFKNR